MLTERVKDRVSVVTIPAQECLYDMILLLDGKAMSAPVCGVDKVTVDKILEEIFYGAEVSA